MKITTGQLRQIIREEIRKVRLTEAQNLQGAKTSVKVGDKVFWPQDANERGMRIMTGIMAGDVTKVVGSKTIEVKGTDGGTYKVSKNECWIIPAKGKNVEISAIYDSGAGSGSWGESTIEGVVTGVDLNGANLNIKSEIDGKKKIHKIYFRSIRGMRYI
jgi:hypothetical protein